MRSPLRDSTTVIWPFFNYVDDREKKYREWDAPWPLVVFARGEGKTHHARLAFLQPRAERDAGERFLSVADLQVQPGALGSARQPAHPDLLLPLFRPGGKEHRDGGGAAAGGFLAVLHQRRDFNGNSRLQVLALTEAFFPRHKSMDRNYSPLWSVWRSEKNPRTGASSQSLLWNLYRRDATPESKKCSLLFGLFQYQSGAIGKRVRLFYVPLSREKAPADAGAKAGPGKSS